MASSKETLAAVHMYDDTLPLLRDVACPSEPVFVPKDITCAWSTVSLDVETANSVKQQIKRFLDMSGLEQKAYMDDLCCVRTVTEEDCEGKRCDEALIGQRGCFAVAAIAPFTLIGHYSGIYVRNFAELAVLQSQYGLEVLKPYLFSVGYPKYPFPMISAFANGNRISMINAAHNYQSEKSEGKKLVALRQNVYALSAKCKNNIDPEIADNQDQADLIFYISLRSIQPNEQLFNDYGPIFW